MGARNGANDERTGFVRDIVQFFSLTGFIYGPLDERLQLKDAVREQLDKPAPKYTFWIDANFFACFGGITFTLFMIQVVTGILLMMYYRPTTADAYSSVVFITNEVPFGWLVRGVHHWAASLMTATVIIHLFKVFVSGAYKPPRDFNWVTGVLLFLMTLVFGFSGYLLPWSQRSYWATTIGTESAAAVPWIGESLKFFARGGTEVGQLTLTRFFALHVCILPFVTGLFLLLHFAMIRRQGAAPTL